MRLLRRIGARQVFCQRFEMRIRTGDAIVVADLIGQFQCAGRLRLGLADKTDRRRRIGKDREAPMSELT